MSRFMRPSKYRHLFADKPRKEAGYENVKVSTSACDTNLVATGGTYMSVNWQVAGGGAFAILPIANSFGPTPVQSKLPDVLPLCRGHSAPVLDTAWSPFDDSVVASGGDDGKVCIWKVAPEDFEGWGEDGYVAKDWEPEMKLTAGGRKVGQVIFHPTASNVLTSASGDHVVRIWDIASGSDSPSISLDAHGDSIQDLAWNSIGTLLATTSRDKRLRLFDPRAGTAPVRITDGHAGVKGSRLVWLGDLDRIVTTGFSKTSDRQVKLWETGGLSELKGLTIDQSSGVMCPFYSEANQILFLSGKGDGNVRYYEYSADELHFLSEYGSKDPTRGMTFLPRRALNVNENEVARAFKLTTTTIEPLAFIVPRKAENFQADIFPPALSGEAALTSGDWFAGKTAQPKLVSLEDGSASTAQPTPSASTFIAPKSTPAPASAPAPTPAPAKAATPPRAASPPPPAPQQPMEVDEQPSAKDLDVKQVEEDSDMEEEKATPPPQAANAAPTASSTGDSSKLEKENAELTAELRESREKIRNLELQVETLRSNTLKLAKQLVSSLESA